MASSLRPLSMALLVLLSLRIPPSLSEFTAVVPDLPAPAGPPRTDPDEQRAVYEVMAATGNGWAASIPDVCREGWHGIECAPDGAGVRHVVSLSFGALSDDTGFPNCDRRSSFLSPALARLPRLRSVFFYRCFNGNPQQIPAFLGGLGPALRTLVLRENGLVGAVPAELGNLTSLRVLDLHGNHLSSWIPPSLASLTRLQLLDMGENSLRGVVPRLRSPLLKVLDLSGNQLGGPIPPTIGDCGLLIKLDLSRNRLGGRIPESLGSLRELILLDLSSNRLTGPLPGSLRSLTSLRSLILSGNHMGPAAIPGEALAGMKDLNTLALSGMGLQGPIPESIGQIAGLRVLHLDGNNLEGTIPGSFRDLGELSELKLDNNRLEGPLPFDRKMLWRMGRKLSVSNNSGLCYDAVATEGFQPGVAPCAAGTTRTRAPVAAAAAGKAASRGGAGERMVKHPAMSDGQGAHPYSSGASAAAHGCGTGLLHLLLPAMGVLLPALPLLRSPWL
ncbi:hypothetical protein Taro_027417 [Colocasia esculenta]|uniref:Uncharacterized protein n=1 Tax=Colocasia esculenta TaxID=4460 RepID=A0A843VUA0_COLES|nr:hypothetical protein [Colocasia esculenta]